MAVSSVTNNTTTTTNGQSSGTKSLTETYETFLSLLTSQIRNQDPLSPMDTTDWTNQLVQYNAVEQQLKANTYLESLVNQSQLSSMTSGVGYIGKVVTGTGDTAALSNGQAQWNLNLAEDAKSVAVNVKDSTGKIVYSETLSDQTAGTKTFNWDGKVASGSGYTSGEFTLSVSALNASGDTVESSVGLSGKVTAVTSEDGETILKIGATSLPLSSVSKVEAAS